MNPRVRYTLIHGMIKVLDHTSTALFELHEFEEFDQQQEDFLVEQFGKIAGFGQASAELFLNKKGEQQ
jgi:hypothetical protein